MGKDPAYNNWLKTNKWYWVNVYNGKTQGFDNYPKSPGNYAIYIIDFIPGVYKKELVYIGTAQNLRVRLQKHEVSKVLRALGNNIMVKCSVIPDKEKRKQQESQLIKRLQPKINMV